MYPPGKMYFNVQGSPGHWPFLSDGMEQPDAAAIQDRLHLLHKCRNELLPHMFKHANGHEFVELALNVPIILKHD